MNDVNIAIINPGAMGISVAATIRNSGFNVHWSATGRSQESVDRAVAHGLVDTGSLAALCGTCEMIVSVCPPHAAVAVADQVLAQGFSGVYLDANAIAPQKSRHIAEKLQADGVTYVDGSIIGGPAWEPGQTWLYLSGPEAENLQRFFTAGPLETAVVSTEIGDASSLKMCFAAYSKGTSALLSMILAGAEALDVREALENQWSRNGSDFAERTNERVRRVTAKAWRFVGEMDEMVATFESLGLPGGFHDAAGDIYSRLATYKDAPATPELEAVLNTILAADD